MKSASTAFMASLTFAAAAGLATVPYMMVVTPIAGARAAIGIGCLLLTVSYVAATARDAARAVRSGAVSLALGLVLVAIAPGPTALVVGAVIALGVVRSGFLYRSRPGRALLLETVLLSSGLALAELLGGGPGPLHTGLAVWGFFLVQSLYFIVGGISYRADGPQDVDPFLKARDAATRMMEEVP